jgi:hypothetical protein
MPITVATTTPGFPASRGMNRMPTQLIGKTYNFDLGPLKIRFIFESQTQGSFVVEEGAGLAPDGHTETVTFDIHEIRDGLYLNSWTEASGATVTHLEDFANATLYSHVTIGGTLHKFVGTITAA